MLGLAQKECQKIVDEACATQDGPPGLVFGMMDRNGKYLAKVAAGVQGLDKSDTKMETDTLFAIYSCTKIITAIAIMQLVEQDKIRLDAPIEDVYPDIKKVRMLDGSEPRTKVTMRMLLSHTGGWSYTFAHEGLRDWAIANGADEYEPGDWSSFERMPLVNQPGSDWAYGLSVDFAGKVLEKVTDKTLGDYCEENIFKPLGCKDIAFGKCRDPERLASLHQIDSQGKVTARSHFGFTTRGSDFHSGGSGCISTLDDFLKILTVMINKGRGANGAHILKSTTVDDMWEDQLAPETAKTLSKPSPVARPELTAFVDSNDGTAKGWMISAMLAKDAWPTGRSAGTAWWAGLVNLFWMADPKKGVCNIIMSQMLPFNSPKTIGPWLACEKAVYASLV